MMFFLLPLLLAIPVSAQLTSQIEFSWEPVPKALLYEVEFTPATQDAEPKIYTAEEAEFSEEMPPGLYFVRIRSVAEDESVSDWSAKMKINVVPASVEMISPQNKSTTRIAGLLTFKWKAKAAAKKYILRVRSKDGKFKKSVTTVGTEQALKLPLGKSYSWQVHFKDKTNTTYESSEEPFTFNLMGKQLAAPKLEKIDFQGGKPVFKWSGDKNSAAFALRILRRELFAEKWEVFKTFEKISSEGWAAEDSLPPGEYKIELGANSPTHLASTKVTKKFIIKPKLEDLAF